MTTKTLLMFATTGLLLPVGLGAADAAPGKVTKNVALARPAENLAPTANGRLRRSNEQQAGHEMPTFACADEAGQNCLYFAMTTELPPLTAGGPVRRATDRVQLSMVPFKLQLTADGSVEAVTDQALSTFVTSNDGNEYRNANHPNAYAINEQTICAEYNYQANNTNDTKRYMMCFNAQTGATLMDQTQIFAKNNDDAAMGQQAGQTSLTVKRDPVTGIHRLVAWRGANGNGRDDGWLQSFTLTQTTLGGPVTFQNQFDASLCPREERSHGLCSVAASDPNTAICSWTEGNTQPQRDGVWLSAVDITPGKFSGANQQNAILWKEQIGGRKDTNGLRTYSMRAHHERVLVPDATGKLVEGDDIFWYHNDLRGSNNGNDKGGTVHEINMAVIRADKNGMSYVTPLTGMANQLRGLGGTHLGMTATVFGTADATKLGLMFFNGSHTGGYFAGQARSVSLDASGAFADGGMIATAENDRHLYPNYLGNNPGNQGRNYHTSRTMLNPLVGQASSTGVINTDKYLMVVATTGKPMAEVGMPEYKPTAFLTVIPVASACGGGGGGGNGTGGGTGAGAPGCGGDDPTDPTNPTDPTDPTDPDDGSDASSSLGGCSTGGSVGGFGMLLLGLAFIIRRRRA